MEKVRYFLPRLPQYYQKNYKQIFVLIALSFLQCLYFIFREKHIHEPTLAFLIAGNVCCFIIAVISNHAKEILSERQSESWDPLQDMSKFKKIIALSLLRMLAFLFGRLGRLSSKGTHTAWSTDMWLASVPFWTLCFMRIFNEKVLLVSIGSTLALISASILMMPLDTFFQPHGTIHHLFGILQAICLGGSTYFSTDLLTTNPRVNILDLISNITVIIPLGLFVASGFVEMHTLLEIFNNPLWWNVVVVSCYGTFLFLTYYLTMTINRDAPSFLSSISWPLGFTISLLYQNPGFSIPGFIFVVIATLVHIHFVYKDSPDLLYRNLKPHTFN